MKTKIATIMALIMLFGAIPVQAENKVFTESGEIVDGDVWNMVDIYNDDTVVDMSGGMCDFIKTYDKSTLNMSGGQADGGAYNHSIMNLSGGTFTSFQVTDFGTINFGGTASGHYITANSSGFLYITGGIIDYVVGNDSSVIDFREEGELEQLIACSSSVVNMHGGVVSDYIGACDYSIINIYGYALHKTSTGGTYGYGQVSGYWIDYTSFNIDIYDAETYSHIVLIPEPGTFLLFGLGTMILRNRNRKK